MDIDTINDFIAGYKQGALYANPDIDVQVVYAGEFEDPAKGKESANSLITAGCDIIFQIAGKTGEGVFEAAAEQKIYAIGVDSDQKYINPDVIICSMKKEVGESIFAAVEEFINNGTFMGGETVVTNMENGFVGVGYGEDTMTQQVSDELKAEVEALKAKIISGEIVVDTTRQ
jgi:basic membrane protein A